MGGRTSSSGNGFSTSVVQATLYHGTNVPDISEFNTSGRESNGAIFFANDPDYAEEEANVKHEARGGTRTMYEVKLDVHNPMTVEMPEKDWAEPIPERKHIAAAKAAGHDAVIFKGTGMFSDQTFYAVFFPKQVKITGRRAL